MQTPQKIQIPKELSDLPALIFPPKKAPQPEPQPPKKKPEVGPRIEPPRRITIPQNTRFTNIMSFLFHPLLVRVDNQSSDAIELCDEEIKPGAIGVDGRHYSFRLEGKASALLPFEFVRNTLWAYSPDGTVIVRVTFADSDDIVTQSKLTAGIGSGGSAGASAASTLYTSTVTILPTDMDGFTP